MPWQLQVMRNEISYTGSLAQPLLNYLQRMNEPAKALLEAFEPFGFGFESMQALASAQAMNQQGLLFTFGWQGSYTFKLDRVEAVFWNLDESGFKRGAEILMAADRTLRKYAQGFQLKRHQLIYSAHGMLQTGQVADVLDPLIKMYPRSGGVRRGAGVIFHWDVPERGWTAQLTLDRSLLVKDGLFLLLSIEVLQDHLDFPSILAQAGQYLLDVLEEIGLALPKGETGL